VMFGADPVAGRADRILISAAHGGPDQLVAGGTQGERYQVTRLGRLVRVDPPERRRARVLGRRRLSRLVKLAKQVQRLFGRPQDVEFGFDEADRLWLFQSRPITAMGVQVARGAVRAGRRAPAGPGGSPGSARPASRQRRAGRDRRAPR
jgi:phosphoenolpyruvate synthase/pyruvate phosphate dikinase